MNRLPIHSTKRLTVAAISSMLLAIAAPRYAHAEDYTYFAEIGLKAITLDPQNNYTTTLDSILAADEREELFKCVDGKKGREMSRSYSLAVNKNGVIVFKDTTQDGVYDPDADMTIYYQSDGDVKTAEVPDCVKIKKEKIEPQIQSLTYTVENRNQGTQQSREIAFPTEEEMRNVVIRPDKNDALIIDIKANIPLEVSVGVEVDGLSTRIYSLGEKISIPTLEETNYVLPQLVITTHRKDGRAGEFQTFRMGIVYADAYLQEQLEDRDDQLRAEILSQIGEIDREDAKSKYELALSMDGNSIPIFHEALTRDADRIFRQYGSREPDFSAFIALSPFMGSSLVFKKQLLLVEASYLGERSNDRYLLEMFGGTCSEAILGWLPSREGSLYEEEELKLKPGRSTRQFLAALTNLEALAQASYAEFPCFNDEFLEDFDYDPDSRRKKQLKEARDMFVDAYNRTKKDNPERAADYLANSIFVSIELSDGLRRKLRGVEEELKNASVALLPEHVHTLELVMYSLFGYKSDATEAYEQLLKSPYGAEIIQKKQHPLIKDAVEYVRQNSSEASASETVPPLPQP